METNSTGWKQIQKEDAAKIQENDAAKNCAPLFQRTHRLHPERRWAQESSRARLLQIAGLAQPCVELTRGSGHIGEDRAVLRLESAAASTVAALGRSGVRTGAHRAPVLIEQDFPRGIKLLQQVKVALEGVTLNQGGSVIPTTFSLYDGDQGIQLLLKVPLATGTVYTINVTGVVDITGNAQSSFPSQSFTTGTGTDLVGDVRAAAVR
jgi:hypothetical protein